MTPPAATASGSRSISAMAERLLRANSDRGSHAARRRVPLVQPCSSEAMQVRTSGFGQGAGDIVGVPGVAHPLQGQHDPVEGVLGAELAHHAEAAGLAPSGSGPNHAESR